MKRFFFLAIRCVLLLAVIGAVAWLAVRFVQRKARREWKEASIEEISERIADPLWPKSESTRLTTRTGGDGWISEHVIMMRNGEWLAYANRCQKQDWRTPDIFLARGSDGRWYYSTFHFCINVVVLRMQEQSEDLASFANAYWLRTFDGHSDDCLQKTR